jgi:hypothetical protein
MKPVEQQIAETRDLGELQRWAEAIRKRIRELREEFEATATQQHGKA